MKRIIPFILLPLLVGCSMTKNIPDDDKLFTGLTKIDYRNMLESNYTSETQTEVEAALATAPNGAIFGSSYHRLPFSVRLSVWNKFGHKQDGFSKWVTRVFGKPPVLMSWVNPQLRASVAQSVLRNHGYLHGQVGYEVVAQKNPKTAKIGYHVDMGHLFTVDTIQYIGFPAEADSLIRATESEAAIRSGSPFSTALLDAERNRISNLLRNNGYYYYQPGYASYLADTFAVNGKAQLRLQMANDIDDKARRKWVIGRININMRKTFMEELTDSVERRYFTVRYHGKHQPLRTRVILADMKLRPRQEFSYDNYLESVAKLNAMGLFSATNFLFSPRQRTVRQDTIGTDSIGAASASLLTPTSSMNTPDTLDLTLNCVFDKPWDTYIETNFNARTIGRMGPELRLGVTRRNAFRGGEKIDINLHGSYEWSTNGGGSAMSNYEYGMDASVEFPRIIAPFFSNSRPRRPRMTADGRLVRRRRRFYSTPSTLAKFSTSIIRRPKYYKMHIVSGEWTYRWQTSAQSYHELSPLTVKYQFKNSTTASFDSIVSANTFLQSTMADFFIPQMRYTYTYTSPKGYQNPIRWETSIAEAGNITSLGMVIAGKSWSEQDKKLFKNVYAQFVKIETDLTKTWTFNRHTQLVGHVNAGVLWSFGNSKEAPFSELFYVGGANSLRAFPIRTVGPGPLPDLFRSSQDNYLVRNGQVKLVANLELRQQLFGNLHGAVFLDAGNVWLNRDLRQEPNNLLDERINEWLDDARFRLSTFLKQMAVGTGIGLRYDLDFLVLRLDWGVGLHVPFDTERSGFYNIDSFSRYQTLNFAIGYPF